MFMYVWYESGIFKEVEPMGDRYELLQGIGSYYRGWEVPWFAICTLETHESLWYSSESWKAMAEVQAEDSWVCPSSNSQAECEFPFPPSLCFI